MKLGIMQPYFFPYLGYFDLINFTNQWIVFDIPQYIRHGWINRNRILNPQKGWQYIIAPLQKHSQKTPIKDICVQNDNKWKHRILAQIQHYKKKTAWDRFKDTYNLVEECLDTHDTSILSLNIRILKKICEKLEIEFNYSIFSKMDLNIHLVKRPGDWALRISELLDVDEYVNLPGGEKLFDKQAFSNLGIKLTIRNLPSYKYNCHGYEFIPNLSIIDLLMWNSPSNIKQYLNYHKG